MGWRTTPSRSSAAASPECSPSPPPRRQPSSTGTSVESSSGTSLKRARTSGPPPRSTTIPYRDTLEGIWISDPVPAWHPIGVRIDRLTEGPKHNLADPALAAALLGASVRDLLTGRPVGLAVPRDGHLLGALFESLVALSLRVFAQAAGAEVHHLRTKNTAHEVDFIAVSYTHLRAH